jgi:U4/U6 small nuclear ribonucleoprotein PRP3
MSRFHFVISLTDIFSVRLANLMKVLTSDAVQDPTKVEAKVRREVAMRKHGHDKMNEERKLTDDQRREKIENKKIDEEKRGIFGAVFKYVSHITTNMIGRH